MDNSPPTRKELAAIYKPEGKSKYGVGKSKASIERRTWDNIVFQSGRECDRYRELKANLAAGIIRDLRLQPKFACYVMGVKVCEYWADFSYIDLDGKYVIEDAKGFKNELYKLKFKLFHACYPDLRIVEV